jgi:hypothetical protein
VNSQIATVKKSQSIQLENGQNTRTGISSKSIYRKQTSTGKDVQSPATEETQIKISKTI